MLGVYLSIKTNSLTGRNISLLTVFDLSTSLIRVMYFNVVKLKSQLRGNQQSVKMMEFALMPQLVQHKIMEFTLMSQLVLHYASSDTAKDDIDMSFAMKKKRTNGSVTVAIDSQPH